MPKVSRSTKRTRISKMIEGTVKHMSTQPVWMVDGTEYTPSEVVARMQAYLDRIDATDSAYVTWRGKLVAEGMEERAIREFLAAWESIVRGTYNSNPAKLASFGLAPRKEGKKSMAVLEQQIARALATRKARGTLGKRQKAKIKGVVPKKKDPQKK